jgi:branched-chain amino acid transport system permease protein
LNSILADGSPGKRSSDGERYPALSDRHGWVSYVFIAAGFLALVPILSTHRVTDFMIFCIFALSFDVLYGFMGRLSFGHILYLGTGAYAAGLFIRYVDKNPVAAILLGVAAAVATGMIIGPIVVRTTGACFALINLAFNQVGFFLVLSPLREFTNGEDGLGIHAAQIGFFNTSSPSVMFWFVFACLLAVFYLLRQLTRSPYGLMVRCINENESRVRFLGYNTFFYKWVTFVIASGVAGLAGTLTTLNYKYVNPNVMDVHSNVGVIFACLIGGAGNLYGALLGGVIYMIISNTLPRYIQSWEMFLGVSLLLIVFRFRQGVWGSLCDLRSYYQRKREQGKS